MPEPVSATIGAAVLGVGSSLIGASASKSAASKQADAATEAAALQADIAREQIAAQEKMFNKQIELQEPWRQAGISALNQIQGGAYGLPAAFTGQVNMLADPGYQFRLSEGMKALDRQAAARGGLISGSALKGAQRFGQDYASQEYQNAYNRALTEYNAQLQRSTTGYNRLAGQAGIGQTATQQLTSAAGTYGSNVGNILGASGAAQAAGITGAANARAAGMVGGANALTGGFNSMLSNYYQQQFLNKLPNRNTAYTTPAIGATGVYGWGGVNPASGEYYGSLEA